MPTVVLAPRDSDSFLRGLFAEDLGPDSLIVGQHRVKVQLGQNEYTLFFRPEELLPVEEEKGER